MAASRPVTSTPEQLLLTWVTVKTWSQEPDGATMHGPGPWQKLAETEGI